MRSDADNIADYLETIPEDRRAGMKKLYETIRKNLPEGFSEGMSYGMAGWCVPHTLFPEGYHCDPSKPLPFMNIANQKNYIVMHHMGLYGSGSLLDWFVSEWPKHSAKKLDMGKGCVRFKNPDEIPHALVAELCKKMTPQAWMDVYEKAVLSRGKPEKK